MPLEIKGKIIAVSPVFVGCGKREYGFTDADLQLIRLPHGGKLLPCIPASSLKGVFRSRSEVLLRQARKKVCNIFGPDNCKKYSGMIKNWEKECSSPEEVFDQFMSNKEICDACKLFGLPGYYSIIQFTNAVPVEESCFDIQTMIAIGPPGTSPKLRTLEYIKPGTNFDFSIKLRRFDERIAWGAGLLLTITKEINEGIIQIGGQKTRGYGWCRIEVEEPKKAEQERLMKKWEEYATHSSTTSS